MPRKCLQRRLHVNTNNSQTQMSMTQSKLLGLRAGWLHLLTNAMIPLGTRSICLKDRRRGASRSAGGVPSARRMSLDAAARKPLPKSWACVAKSDVHDPGD